MSTAPRHAGWPGPLLPEHELQVSYYRFAHAEAKHGMPVTETLSRHVAYLTRLGRELAPGNPPDKHQTPTLYGAICRDGRRTIAHIEAMRWFFFDADNVGSWDRLLEWLDSQGAAYVAAQSCGHGESGADKWHLFLLFEAPHVPSQTYRHEYTWICRLLADIGGLSDYDHSCKNINRGAFVGQRLRPTAAPRRVRHSVRGRYLSWDGLLRATGYSAPAMGSGRAYKPRAPRAPVDATMLEPGALRPIVDAPPARDEAPWITALRIARHCGSAAYPIGDDKIAIACPWRDDHTSGVDFDSSTVVWPGGGWSCLHSHCEARLAEIKAEMMERAEALGRPMATEPSNTAALMRWARQTFGDDAPLFNRPRDEWMGRAKKVEPETVGAVAGSENDSSKKKVAQTMDTGNNEDLDSETPDMDQPTEKTGEQKRADARAADAAQKAAEKEAAKAAKRAVREDKRREFALGLGAEAEKLMLGDKGTPLVNQANLIRILTHHDDWHWTDESGAARHVLALDEMAIQILKTAAPKYTVADGTVGEWTAEDTTCLCAWYADKYGMTVPPTAAIDAVRVVAGMHGFHHVREYLSGLVWDGVPRLDTWLSRYLGAEQTEYTRLAGSMWTISAVARAYDPGCKADHTLVLEGRQGRGKSTAFNILGGAFYRSTKINLHKEPDCFQKLRGVWIYEIAEISKYRAADADDLKNYLSDKVDRYRDSYGRMMRDWHRGNVFGGTVNPDEGRDCTYLTDPTGGRRFWPVLCFVTREWCDFAALTRDRDQLWAEAAHRYRAGEKWYPTPEQEPLFAVQQQARSVDNESDPWDEVLCRWLASNATTALLTPTVILQYAICVPTDRLDQRQKIRVGKCMRRLGWAPSEKQRYVGGTKGFPFEPALDEVGQAALTELLKIAERSPKDRDQILRSTYGGPLTTERLQRGVAKALEWERTPAPAVEQYHQ